MMHPLDDNTIRYDFTLSLRTERPDTPEQAAAVARLAGLLRARLNTLIQGGEFYEPDEYLDAIRVSIDRTLGLDSEAEDSTERTEVVVESPEHLPIEVAWLGDEDLDEFISQYRGEDADE